VNNLGQGGTLPGKDIFKLYDTYGFPPEITKEILSEYHISLDFAGFEVEMAQQKSRGRQSWVMPAKDSALHIARNPTVFVGYTQTEIECQIIDIMNGEKDLDSEFGETRYIILDKTPFYAESGGQLADQGELLNEKNEVLAIITDVQKTENNIYLHHAQIKKQVREGKKVIARINLARRNKLKTNHSVTHLLHAALREIFGDHVTQKGSLVAEEYLRFDFSHGRLLSREETENIENRVNQIIRENAQVVTKLKSKDTAIKEGALSLFGEKYSEEVRVVAMGNDSFSLELCGGTHLERTGDIGLFKIISCETIASGIKRIEALTGQNALEYLRNQILKLNNDRNSLEKKYSKLQKDNRALQQQILSIKINSTEGQKINNITLISKIFKDISIKDLHSAAINHRNSATASILLLFSTVGKTVNFIIAITKDIAGEKFNAAELARVVNQVIGGKGGGKQDFAQGGGGEISKISDGIIKLEQCLKKI
jgi:alanyl-tRNA synthetase